MVRTLPSHSFPFVCSSSCLLVDWLIAPLTWLLTHSDRNSSSSWSSARWAYVQVELTYELLQNVQVEIATWHCIHTVDISLSCSTWCIACPSSRSMLGPVCYLYNAFMCYINHSENVYWNGIFILKLISIYLPEWFIYSRPSSPHLQLKRLMRYCWWKGQMDGGR